MMNLNETIQKINESEYPMAVFDYIDYMKVVRSHGLVARSLLESDECRFLGVYNKGVTEKMIWDDMEAAWRTSKYE